MEQILKHYFAAKHCVYHLSFQDTLSVQREMMRLVSVFKISISVKDVMPMAAFSY